ncbi:MAG: prepilin-type N-terminal cleavage/methylation domain-containing protein [Uliginosibacterium sp.]|nr:prepilin-type N-terminal cleavage/methylation domain-containing protein [Uliginosibacterium sp.]
MSRHTRLSQRAGARGVTLVELMIAMVLGLLILAAVSAVYLSSKQTFRANDNLARVQENVRTAFDTLTHDIREAAFFGCAGQDTVKDLNFINALNNNTRLLFDFKSPVFGYEAISTTAWNETPDSGDRRPLTGRDILVVRTVAEGGGPIVEQDKTNLRLSVSENSGIVVGDILLANNCKNVAVFQATAVATNAKLDVISAGVGVQTPGNSINDFLKATPFKDGELRRIVTRVYYVADNAAGLPSCLCCAVTESHRRSPRA